MRVYTTITYVWSSFFNFQESAQTCHNLWSAIKTRSPQVLLTLTHVPGVILILFDWFFCYDLLAARRFCILVMWQFIQIPINNRRSDTFLKNDNHAQDQRMMWFIFKLFQWSDAWLKGGNFSLFEMKGEHIMTNENSAIYYCNVLESRNCAKWTKESVPIRTT